MKSHHRRALKLTGIYLVFGLAWITLSDAFTSGLTDDPDTLTRLQNLKGWLFILLTAALVWFLANRALARQIELGDMIARREARLRSIFENVNDGILIYDLDNERITGTNPKLQRMFGCRPDQVGTLTIRDLSSPEPADNADTAARHMASAREGMPSVFEWHVQRPDGSRLWVEVTIRATEMGGRPHCLMVVRNISQRREIMERLRLSAEVFENARDGIVITDGTPTMLDVNPAFCRITGYERSELLGRDPRFLRTDGEVPREHLGMWQALRKHGYWQGEVTIRSRTGRERDQMLTISAIGDLSDGPPEHYVGLYTDITDLKSVQRKLEELAYYDPLTRLPNRLLFHSRVDAALLRADKDHRVAVVYMDLDNFKNINDSFGHPVGDDLLVEISQRLRGLLSEHALLAHLAGDEFALLLTELNSDEAAGRIARDLLADLEKPFELAGGSAVYISACAGISVCHERDKSAMEMIQFAHAALYQAKKSGRRSLHFFTPGLVDEANARIHMEARLHDALDNNEFLVHYQPLVGGANGERLEGVEALCRWQPPGGDMVPPDRFIPLAEESGLILPLGRRILREACRQMQVWHTDGHADLILSVNLSARQFENDDIVATVREALADSGLPAASLQLELTESLLMGYGPDMQVRLAALSDLGVKLVLDDFGTGYSCLAYLHRMPLDLIKIDRSFITDMLNNKAARELVTAIISMAGCMNLDVLAEGIEEREQLELVSGMGCRRFQGYLFGRPAPAAEIEARLAGDIRSSPAGIR